MLHVLFVLTCLKMQIRRATEQLWKPLPPINIAGHECYPLPEPVGLGWVGTNLFNKQATEILTLVIHDYTG